MDLIAVVGLGKQTGHLDLPALGQQIETAGVVPEGLHVDEHLTVGPLGAHVLHRNRERQPQKVIILLKIGIGIFDRPHAFLLGSRLRFDLRKHALDAFGLVAERGQTLFKVLTGCLDLRHQRI